jgi:hypothetical protein
VLYLVLTAFGVVSYMFNSSVEGTIMVLSLVILTGVVLTVLTLSVPDLRRFVAVPLLVTATIQAVVVAIQSATGSATVFSILHPGSVLQVTNGDIVRPQGTFEHVYVAAGLAIVAVGIGLALLPGQGLLRGAFLVGLGAAASTVALTHSRAAVLGLALVVIVGGVASVRGDGGLRVGIGVVLVAFIVPALVTASGWQARLDESVEGAIDDASLGRVTLAKQALVMAGDHPVVGVGPARYLEVLETRYTPDPEHPFAVHNVPLLVTAELGIAAGIVFTIVLVWTGVRALVGGARQLLLFAALLPFLMFDNLFYSRPVGLFMFAVWCGSLAALHQSHRQLMKHSAIADDAVNV